MKRPIAINEERPFHEHELFFSVTDKRGKLTFGNETFIRISGYEKHTLIGAPHSIIRHPDMPKSVFKLFWEHLHQNLPVGAYVKNLANDGKYYWVFAFAFPVEDGYLSIRMKPSSQLFLKAQEFYKKVLEQEDPKSFTTDYLLELLQKEGFKTYQEFMVMAAVEEFKSREIQLAKLKKFTSYGNQTEINKITSLTAEALDISFSKITNFQDAGEVLSKSIHDLNTEFKKLSFISINMNIIAANFGSVAASLEVVSTEFTKLSAEISKHFEKFDKFVLETSQLILDCSQCIISLKTQMIMVEYFVKESLEKANSSEHAFDEMLANEQHFCLLFEFSLKLLSSEMKRLQESILNLGLLLKEIHSFILGLEMMKLIGSLEASRDDRIKVEFESYLKEMSLFVQLLKKVMQEIERQNKILNHNAIEILDSNTKLSGSINMLFETVKKEEVKTGED